MVINVAVTEYNSVNHWCVFNWFGRQAQIHQALDKHNQKNQKSEESEVFYCQVGLHLPGICFGVYTYNIEHKNTINTTHKNIKSIKGSFDKNIQNIDRWGDKSWK